MMDFWLTSGPRGHRWLACGAMPMSSSRLTRAQGAPLLYSLSPGTYMRHESAASCTLATRSSVSSHPAPSSGLDAGLDLPPCIACSDFGGHLIPSPPGQELLLVDVTVPVRLRG